MKGTTNFGAQLEQMSPRLAVVRASYATTSTVLVTLRAEGIGEESLDCLYDIVATLKAQNTSPRPPGTPSAAGNASE